ncbi:LADA_0B09450g1_1 [Lachancea dasiensis]|uniref:LADA_0B09450g1_1 n=1 Tax=Lachancea dasiensis TaxID=1072105 RepID=A0A1G4IUY2_9SACH|nr:LADA_0B09450g1_1 [Lachancea dasiensis]
MARDLEKSRSKVGADPQLQLARRRRRKVVKSCTFCRQRKLKCDQQKPMCGQCAARKLPECVYTDGFNFQLTSDELFSDKPNVSLIRRIQELEEALEKSSLDDQRNGSGSASSANCLDSQDDKTAPGEPGSSDTHTSTTSTNGFSNHGSISGPSTGSSTSVNYIEPAVSATGSKGPNKLADFSVMRLKDGRFTYYGPTSIRAIITASGDRFVAEYVKVWNKVKAELNASKTVHGRQLIAEYSSLIFANTGSLIESVVPDLPPYETIESRLHEYFDDPLHTYFLFLDKEKVLRDFSKCFMPGYVTNSNDNVPRRQVAMLVIPDNNNYFTIGVVLMILCLNHYKTAIPASIQRLFVSLAGFTTAKSMFVERAQFLLLIYIFRVYNGLNGSGSAHLVSLTSLLCTTSMNLGLHKDIDKLYAGQSPTVGPLQCLKNLWYWTLFADLNVSFDIGSPVFVTSEHFDDAMLPTAERGRIPLLRNFLYVSRRCLHQLYDRSQSPSTLHFVEQLTTFIEREFRPLSCYTDLNLFSEIDLFEIMILSPTLAMMTNFYDLTRLSGAELSIRVKNGFIKSMLVGASVAVNTILRCYELDEQHPPTVNFQQSKILTPSLNLCVLLLNSLPVRTLTETYGLMFHKLMLFEKGLIVSLDAGSSDGPTLDDLSVPDSIFLSFRGIFLKFCSIFDELWKPEKAKMTHMLWKSHYFVIIMALERVNRTVFQMGLEYRTQVEVDYDWPKLGNDEVSDDVVKMLADQVWNTYSTGITDLIEMDAGDFLTDFDMFAGE